MANNKRSKALNRVIKLLNLATSDVDHEADLALNHAHSVIYSHNIQREEIDPDKLCDGTVLAQIDWFGDWTDRPEPVDPWELEAELEMDAENYQPYVIREKNTWLEKQQARDAQSSPDTDTDNLDLTAHTLEPEPEPELEPEPEPEPEAATQQNSTLILDAHHSPAPDPEPEATPPSFDEIVESGAFMVFERTPSPLATCPPETSNDDNEEPATLSLTTEESGPDTPDDDCSEPLAASAEVSTDYPLTVVDDSDTPAPLNDESFNESEARTRLTDVIGRIIAAKDRYTAYRDEREQGDIDEEEEKAIRIQAEIEAEEAAERAFRERAEAQLIWEANMRELRQERRHREQSALKKLRSLRDEHEDLKKRLAAHESWKAEQARLALLDEISNQLQVAADHIADAENPALARALFLMDDNELTLTDLPLARIHHKSIFMQLLEREARTLETSKEREKFTQKLLGEYLAVYHPPTIDLASKVLELLKVASSGVENAEDAFEDAREIMDRNSMSIRDLDISQINQISLFVRLLNWEADKLLDMDAREHFTAKMLDKYFEATTKV